MTVMNGRKVAQQYDFEPISISVSDYAAGKNEGESVGAQEVAEVLEAEISDANGVDSQLASYDVVRLGDNMDKTGNSAQGKIYADLRDGGDAAIDARTQIRWCVRPKNGNRRDPLTNWYSLRDLNQDRPDHRIPLAPVTYEGKPAYAQDGRLLVIEARNPATSFTLSRANSVVDVPARGGY